MSKSLALVGGDLSVRNRGFETVTARDKLVQDLALWVMERLGDDPDNPDLGTRFDSEDYIGVGFQQAIADDAKIEMQQMLDTYQTNQLNKIKKEALLYAGQTTIPPSEQILSVDSIDVGFAGTTMTVKAQVTTGDGASVSITAPVSLGLDT
jgi:hypothetical protein